MTFGIFSLLYQIYFGNALSKCDFYPSLFQMSMLFSDISVAVGIADIIVSRFLRNLRYSILTRRRNPESV